MNLGCTRKVLMERLIYSKLIISIVGKEQRRHLIQLIIVTPIALFLSPLNLSTFSFTR